MNMQIQKGSIVTWSKPRCFGSMLAGILLVGYQMKDTNNLGRLFGIFTNPNLKKYDNKIDQRRNNQLFYFTLSMALSTYSAWMMVFLPKVRNIWVKAGVPFMLFGYLTEKFDYFKYPFEKHFMLMFFNCSFGALLGLCAIQSKTIKNRYMDFFMLWCYSFFYLCAFIFKQEYDRYHYLDGEHAPRITELNLLLNSAAFTLASGLYATGVLKLVNMP